MPRRRRKEVPVSHERWLVSYADFITILLAFFVVMYSISSVNEGKYQVLSESLGNAFGSAAPASVLLDVSVLEPPEPAGLRPEPVDDVTVPLLLEYQAGSKPIPLENAGQRAEPGAPGEADDFTQRILNAAEAEIDEIADDVELEVADLVNEDLINIKRNKFWLEVEVKSSLLFASGSSDLLPASVPALLKLADIFADLPNRIHVEGFTDDQPINTRVFPSNWELSAARAAAVVRLFEKNAVDPSRMASIGYGEYHSIADNDSEEGRAKNRRVVMIVMASLEGQGSERVYEFELLKERSQGSGTL